jgi:hypothetical protein
VISTSGAKGGGRDYVIGIIKNNWKRGQEKEEKSSEKITSDYYL